MMLPVPSRRRRGWLDPAWWESDFEPMFRRLWNEAPWGESPEERTAAYPADIREEDDAIVVDAEMPGFKSDDINVDIDQDVLRITAEHKPEEKKEEKGKSHLRERMYARVERAFTLPCAVDENNAEAKYEDGVLHLRLPKAGERKPRRIQVK